MFALFTLTVFYLYRKKVYSADPICLICSSLLQRIVAGTNFCGTFTPMTTMGKDTLNILQARMKQRLVQLLQKPDAYMMKKSEHTRVSYIIFRK